MQGRTPPWPDLLARPTAKWKDHADGSYRDFLTGFVTKDRQVRGRPVGAAVGRDGDLFVTDDSTRSVWRVSDVGK